HRVDRPVAPATCRDPRPSPWRRTARGSRSPKRYLVKGTSSRGVPTPGVLALSDSPPRHGRASRHRPRFRRHHSAPCPGSRELSSQLAPVRFFITDVAAEELTVHLGMRPTFFGGFSFQPPLECAALFPIAGPHLPA